MKLNSTLSSSGTAFVDGEVLGSDPSIKSKDVLNESGRFRRENRQMQICLGRRCCGCRELPAVWLMPIARSAPSQNLQAVIGFSAVELTLLTFAFVYGLIHGFQVPMKTTSWPACDVDCLIVNGRPEELIRGIKDNYIRTIPYGPEKNLLLRFKIHGAMRAAWNE